MWLLHWLSEILPHIVGMQAGERRLASASPSREEEAGLVYLCLFPITETARMDTRNRDGWISLDFRLAFISLSVSTAT